MKNIFFIAILLFSVTMFGQQATIEQVKVGDVLTIGKPSGNDYQHIKIPKKNFIIKRGGIANIKALKGTQVVITKVHTKNQKSYIIVTRKDGGKFFGSHKTLTAYLGKSINSGELVVKS